MKIIVKVENKEYEITDDTIDVYKRTLGTNYGNGFGTLYTLRGTKTVIVTEYNCTWACRGMGMNDRRTMTIVNKELYDKIKETIEKVKEINETEKDEAIRYEKLVEALKDITTDLHYDYVSEEDEHE